jgi:hypothetical protein
MIDSTPFKPKTGRVRFGSFPASRELSHSQGVGEVDWRWSRQVSRFERPVMSHYGHFFTGLIR